MKTADGQGQGTSGAQIKFEYTLPEELTFDFLFDNTGLIDGKPKPHGIFDDVARFRKCSSTTRATSHEPYHLKLVWGNLIFKGRAIEVGITYKLFNPDGQPIRAVVRVKFKGSIEEKKRAAMEDAQSPDLTHRRTVKPGDTLPLLCFEVYGDPRHYLLVADFNGLDDFRRLDGRAAILFPPLARADGPPMTDASVIPTPATPDVCSVGVLIDGTEISGEFHVLSASVSNELNRIPAASVQLRDGEASKQTFEASATPTTSCPARRSRSSSATAARPRPCSRGSSSSSACGCARTARLLSLECRDKAVRMTSGLQEPLLHRHDRQRHPRRAVRPVQPRPRRRVDEAVARRRSCSTTATDWDFLVCRAEANGHVVAVRDGKVTVGPPKTDGPARGHRPVRGDRARARRRDRRPLAGQGRHGHGLERHRPGARRRPMPPSRR